MQKVLATRRLQLHMPLWCMCSIQPTACWLGAVMTTAYSHSQWSVNCKESHSVIFFKPFCDFSQQSLGLITLDTNQINTLVWYDDDLTEIRRQIAIQKLAENRIKRIKKNRSWNIPSSNGISAFTSWETNAYLVLIRWPLDSMMPTKLTTINTLNISTRAPCEVIQQKQSTSKLTSGTDNTIQSYQLNEK